MTPAPAPLASRRLSMTVRGIGVVLIAVTLAACAPARSNGGDIVVVPTDARITEVRAAREALATPVPLLLASAEATSTALAEVWAAELEVAARAKLAAELDMGALRTARDGLAAVELVGIGPDVEAATALVATMLADADVILGSGSELADLIELPAFDVQLEAVVEVWSDRGSRSQQQRAFDDAAVAAGVLADDAAARTAVTPCLNVWGRRVAAATLVADRTAELRRLINAAQGLEFDALRKEYAADPYGDGLTLAAADAAAGATCYPVASAVPDAVERLRARVGDLGGVLDPADLRGQG